MFKRVLIANRGEVAIRIARTCQRLGMSTVAVHDEADTESYHLQVCDEVYPLATDAARATSPYFDAEAVIRAAKTSGAEAVHPGYGLLSESPSFARMVKDAGLVFVGPSVEVLEILTDKTRARSVARTAGLRVLPGTDEPVTDPETGILQAQHIGYPMVLKPAIRGSGLGAAVVADEYELGQAVAVTGERMPEADGQRVHPEPNGQPRYLERFIAKARVVEVQVVADATGQVVALGERECSLQHNGQKIIEESSAPLFAGSPDCEFKRQVLWDGAVRIAKDVGYHSAGTAEFIADADGKTYFLGFAPRLQIHHALTELCTELDLVELQLRIAQGESLTKDVLQVQPAGSAMGARVYAQDPAQGLEPCTGLVKELRWPALPPGKLRIETGYQGQATFEIGDDPLIAKVVAFGPTRHQALLTLDRALAQTVISPLATNLGFLREILGHRCFQAGQYDASFAQRVLEGG